MYTHPPNSRCMKTWKTRKHEQWKTKKHDHHHNYNWQYHHHYQCHYHHHYHLTHPHIHECESLAADMLRRIEHWIEHWIPQLPKLETHQFRRCCGGDVSTTSCRWTFANQPTHSGMDDSVSTMAPFWNQAHSSVVRAMVLWTEYCWFEPRREYIFEMQKHVLWNGGSELDS